MSIGQPSPISHKNQIITLGKVTPQYYSYTEAFKIAHARLTCLCSTLVNEQNRLKELQGSVLP